MLSLKIDENILNFNFLMGERGRGGELGILTVYVNTLKRSFIDIKNDEVYGNL